MRRALVSAGVATTLIVGAAACGGDRENGGEEGRTEYMRATELCGGIFSPTAARALEEVTGQKEFTHLHREEEMRQAAEGLIRDFGEHLGAPKSSWESFSPCLIYTKRSRDLASVKITFEGAAPEILDDPDYASSLNRYEMGRVAVASARTSSIYFECVTPEIGITKSKPALIYSHLYHRWKQDGKNRKASDANLTVLHSAALALAKELRCEDDGGLPNEPVLKLLP